VAGSATRSPGVSPLWCALLEHNQVLTQLSEVFVVVSLTLFLPICLEQFARDNGMFLPDRIMPCNTIRGQPDEASPGGDERRCSVKIGWLWIDTASFR
jgi:UMF1 family MFS transporter